MSSHDEWNELLKNLFSNAIRNHKETLEGEYANQRQMQIDEMLTTNLTKDEKNLIDEILFELGLAAERETEAIYRQGLKDCIWLLKNLGVLA